jgi:hypothetical protein
MVFAELAVKFDTQKELEHRVSAFTHLPMPLNAAFQAGKAFEKYRAGGGKKARPLPDFLSAHTRTLRTCHCSHAIRDGSAVSFLRYGWSRRKSCSFSRKQRREGPPSETRIARIQRLRKLTEGNEGNEEVTTLQR